MLSSFVTIFPTCCDDGRNTIVYELTSLSFSFSFFFSVLERPTLRRNIRKFWRAWSDLVESTFLDPRVKVVFQPYLRSSPHLTHAFIMSMFLYLFNVFNVRYFYKGRNHQFGRTRLTSSIRSQTYRKFFRHLGERKHTEQIGLLLRADHNKCKLSSNIFFFFWFTDFYGIRRLKRD